MLARHQQVPRFSLGSGCKRPDADGGQWLGVTDAGAKVATVERECLLGAAPVGEEIRVRIRKPEVRRELRAVIGTAEDPDLRGRGALGMRANVTERVPRGQ